jgi:hypothetical protein
MTRITISYRRDDSLDITGRIFDRLGTHYGREAVFRDIDDIPPGVDFRSYISQMLDASDIVLAVVGPRWIGPSSGHNRLGNEADPVRIEVETALGKGISLIPVLVMGADMPRAEQLPESLAEFAYRNAVRIDSGQDFDGHISRLIRGLDLVLKQSATRTPSAASAPTETEPRPGVGEPTERPEEPPLDKTSLPEPKSGLESLEPQQRQLLPAARTRVHGAYRRGFVLLGAVLLVLATLFAVNIIPTPHKIFSFLSTRTVSTAPNVPGHVFVLKAKRIGPISVGSPVFYRDLNVGEVLSWDIADMVEYVTIRAFVRAPYDSFVHDTTRFWISDAVPPAGSDPGRAEGSRMPAIAFETPEADIHIAVTAENHIFPLFANRDAADNASYPRKIPMISYFAGSVHGLAAGSNVTMHGLKIGSVTDVRLDSARDLKAAVWYELEPERSLGVGRHLFVPDGEAVDALLKRGLRASLQSASPATGQQEVALDFVQDAPPVPVTMEGGAFVLPTVEPEGSSGSGTPTATQVLQPTGTARTGRPLH